MFFTGGKLAVYPRARYEKDLLPAILFIAAAGIYHGVGCGPPGHACLALIRKK